MSRLDSGEASLESSCMSHYNYTIADHLNFQARSDWECPLNAIYNLNRLNCKLLSFTCASTIPEQKIYDASKKLA